MVAIDVQESFFFVRSFTSEAPELDSLSI